MTRCACPRACGRLRRRRHHERTRGFVSRSWGRWRAGEDGLVRLCRRRAHVGVRMPVKPATARDDCFSDPPRAFAGAGGTVAECERRPRRRTPRRPSPGSRPPGQAGLLAGDGVEDLQFRRPSSLARGAARTPTTPASTTNTTNCPHGIRSVVNPDPPGRAGSRPRTPRPGRCPGQPEEGDDDRLQPEHRPQLAPAPDRRPGAARSPGPL